MFCPGFFRRPKRSESRVAVVDDGCADEPEHAKNVVPEELLSRFGVYTSTIISPNSAGIAIWFAEIAAIAEFSSIRLCAEVNKGLLGMGGVVETATRKVQLIDVLKIDIDKGASSQDGQNKHNGVSTGWIHFSVALRPGDEKLSVRGRMGPHVGSLAGAVVSAIRMLPPDRNKLHSCGLKLLDARLLANPSPIQELNWTDIEHQDDPARRDSVGHMLTEVREVWWMPPGEEPRVAQHCVTKWINRGLSLCGPHGVTEQPNRFIEEEAAILSAFRHANIMAVVGLLPADHLRPTALVMPHMANGSLRHFLRTRRAKCATKKLRASLVVDVACGLAFLHAHGMWHGDVAARNVLLSDQLQCKISNVGRSVGASRWSAPEIFRGEAPSTTADIWSFGVLVFEVMSNGRLPFCAEESLDAVGKTVLNGGFPELPLSCPTDVARRLMLNCWRLDPSDRPCASSLKLQAIIVGGVEWGQPFIVSVAEAVQAVKYRRKTRDAPPADSKSCETDDDTTAELSGVPVPRIKLPPIRASNAVFPDTSSTGRQSQLPETPAASDTALSSSDEATDGESVMSSLHEHRVLDLERSYKEKTMAKIKKGVTINQAPSGGSYRSRRRMAVRSRLNNPDSTATSV